MVLVGASLSPKSQRALWDQIYSALEKKGCRAVWLNALSPNIPIDVENGPDFDKMDIIGCDVYGYKSAKNLKVVDEKYKLAKAKGKLFTVSEFGAYSAHNRAATGVWNVRPRRIAYAVRQALPARVRHSVLVGAMGDS